jgi:hypothetical protein
MALAILSLIAFFALFAWRFVFAGLRREPLAREIFLLRQQQTSVLERDLHIFDLTGLAALRDNSPESCSNGTNRTSPRDCAKTYLRRIAVLTGATQMGGCYTLDVGTTRFYVRDRHVGRIRDTTDPKCEYEETCFYAAEKEMPKSEHIATALLQLKSNPALFDKWAAQSAAYKADGQVFDSAP